MPEKSVLRKICHESYSVKQIKYHISICRVCKYCKVVFEDFHQKKFHSCPESLKICNICLKKFDLTKSRYMEKTYKCHKLACGVCKKCDHVSKTNIDFITHKCDEFSKRKRAFISAANVDSGNIDEAYPGGT